MAKLDNVECWYCTFKNTTFQEAKEHFIQVKKGKWSGKILHVIEDYHILEQDEQEELWHIVRDFGNRDTYFLLTRRKLASISLKEDPILSELEESENQKTVIDLQKQLDYREYITGIVGSFVRTIDPSWAVPDEEKQEFARKMSTTWTRLGGY